MQFVFNYDPSIANAPAGFLSALAAAASYLDALITNPITVTVNVGWGEVDGVPLPDGDVAGALPASTFSLPYSTVRAALLARASSADDATATAGLPPVDPLFLSPNLIVATTEAKAWGLILANGTEVDGSIGFNSAVPFSFDSANRGVLGEYDFIGAVEHELTHILGRFSRLGENTPLDLFRYAGPNFHPLLANMPSYFSIDGGDTNLAPFDPLHDLADWGSSVHGDSFGYTQRGIPEQVTASDITAMDVLGYDVAPTPPALSRSGSYAFAAPDSDTALYLSGTGQVTLSGGGGTVTVLGGADTIFAAPGASANSITNYGSLFFDAGGSQSQTVDLVTRFGAATLVGAANNVMIRQDDAPRGSTMMVAGAGNETLFGAESSSEDQYWGSFGHGNDLMVAGSGTDILVGGSGTDTMVGGSGTDVFYVVSAEVIDSMTGTAATPGQDVIAGAKAGDTLALTGFDSLYGAAGSGAASRFVSAALSSGAITVALADGTSIRFVGATSGLRIVSS
jgi:hypothetical protein